MASLPGWRTTNVLVALLVVWAAPARAHPMPNSEIAISAGADSVVFEIAIPEPELRLALPQSWGRTADLLVEPYRSALADYFDAHFGVRTASGKAVPHVIQFITRWQARNLDVGNYEELRIRIVASAVAGFDPHSFSLHYDAVIHQVPNHFALVYLDRDFHAGRITDETPVEVGVIRYDFSRDVTPVFEVTLAAGSAWRGVLSAVSLGFQHVLSGVDHLLFLACLLMVSPLRALARRWSLFQGWRYTLRRFLCISLAFTAGHTVSLVLGAYEWLHLPARWVEMTIALSVLLAAVHAIRPLFAGSEWKIAGGFGLVHGSPSRDAIRRGLDPLARAYVVLGFNLGVEARSSWRWSVRCRCCMRADGVRFMRCGLPPWCLLFCCHDLDCSRAG